MTFDPIKEPADRSCDSKAWCPSCQRSEYETSSEKYLCKICGKEMDLDHEVHHEHFPHISGTEGMS
jgi:hypothetical protein